MLVSTTLAVIGGLLRAIFCLCELRCHQSKCKCTRDPRIDCSRYEGHRFAQPNVANRVGANFSMRQNRKKLWFAIWCSLLVGVILSVSPDSAAAHGAHDAKPGVSKSFEDIAHADEGHPGHCHGGAFCSGIAIIGVPPLPPELLQLISRLTVPTNYRLASPSFGLDPPPPRLLF
jgi:hypothetical protein